MTRSSLEGASGVRVEAHSFNTHESSDGFFLNRNGRRAVDMSNIAVSQPGSRRRATSTCAELDQDPRTTPDDWRRWTRVASQIGALDEAGRAQLGRPELQDAVTTRAIDLFLPQESMERLAALDPDRAAEAVRQAYRDLGDGDPPSRGEAREQAVRFSRAIREHLDAARTGTRRGCAPPCPARCRWTTTCAAASTPWRRCWAGGDPRQRGVGDRPGVERPAHRLPLPRGADRRAGPALAARRSPVREARAPTRARARGWPSPRWRPRAPARWRSA